LCQIIFPLERAIVIVIRLIIEIVVVRIDRENQVFRVLIEFILCSDRTAASPIASVTDDRARSHRFVR